MPIYEYRCTACGHQQEFLQKASDTPRTVCTKCGKETFSKLLSAAGFQLKGSGWYVTDFRGGSGGSKKSEKPDAPAGDAAKSETKGDAKTEAKSESTTKSESSAPAAPSTSTTPSSSSES